MLNILKKFKKKYVLLLAFLGSTLLSIGASTWLVIRENTFKPGYVKLQTPIELSYTISNDDVYEYQIEDLNGLVNQETLMKVCGISIVPNINVSGTLTCTNLEDIYFASNTTGSASTVNAKFKFSPTNQANYLDAEIEVPINIHPICYAGSNYYGSLNRALEAAGTTPVAIIPGNNGFKIHRNVTIGEGQTVVVPHDDYWNSSSCYDVNGNLIELYDYKDENGNRVTNMGHFLKVTNDAGTIYHQYLSNTRYNFADANSNTVSTYKKTEIKVNKNVTITNKGELSVLGVIGGFTHGISGHTSDKYAQITLESGAKIINEGIMEVRGYIKEATSSNGSQVVNQNGGKLSLPFVFYDNQGARQTIGMYMAGNIFPYSGFNFPNIHAKIISYGNANIYGLASMFTGYLHAGYDVSLFGRKFSITIEARHNYMDVPIFTSVNNSESGIFNFTSETGRVEMTYNPYNFGYSVNRWSNGRDANYSMRGVTDIDIFGGLKTGNVTLSIFLGNPDPIILNSSSTIFPISWLLDIEFNSGTYEIAEQLKIMSGARLKVNAGATLLVSSPTVVYSTFNDVVSGSNDEYPYISNQNGLLVANGGNITIASQFGGIVHAEGTGQSALNITTSNLTNKIVEGTGAFTTSAGDIINIIGIGAAFDIMDYMNNENNVKFADIKGSIVKLSSAQFVTAPDESARGYIYTNGIKSPSYENFAQTRYYSSNGGWYTGEYTINVTFNYNDGNDPVTYPIKVGHHQQLTINESFLKQFEIEREHYIFKNWTLENGDSPIGTINSDITIYANWDEKQYDIDYDIQYLYGSSYEEGDQIIYEFENPTKFTINSEDMTFYHPTHSRFYVFKGWYYDSTYKTSVIDDLSVLSAETLSDYLVDNKVTLYGYWTVENMDINYISINNDKTLTSSRVPIYQDAFNEFDFYEQSYVVDSDVTYSKYVEGFYKDEACTIRVEGLTLDYFTAEEFDEMAENKLLTIYVKWADKLTVNYTDPSNIGYTLPTPEFVAPTLLNEYTFENGEMDDGDEELHIPTYFNGWSYEGIAIDSFADLTEEQLTAIKTAGSATLDANWANKVVVTFVDESTNGYASETIYLNPSQFRNYDLETYETNMNNGDTTPTQTTYFNGWKYNDTVITSFVDLSFEVIDSIISAGSVTIKADWANKIHIKYIKIFDGSVVANSSETIKWLMPSQLNDSNVNTVTLADQSGQNNDYSYQYYFLGWYKDISIENINLLSDTSATVSLKDMDVINGEIIIYHAWESKAAILIKINSGGWASKGIISVQIETSTWQLSSKGSQGTAYIKKGTTVNISGTHDSATSLSNISASSNTTGLTCNVTKNGSSGGLRPPYYYKGTITVGANVSGGTITLG